MRKSSLLAASLAFTVLGALPAGAQTAPSVAVRAGSHESFDRVVFDWPRDVKFQLRREGDRAEITFDAAANLKFSADVQSELTRARGFNARTDDAGRVTVSFNLAPGATVKSFTSNSSVVIDIAGKGSADKGGTAPQAAASTTPAPATKTQPETPQPSPAPAAGDADPTAATDKPQPLLPAPTAAKAAPSRMAAAPQPPTAFPKSTVAPTVDASPMAPAKGTALPGASAPQKAASSAQAALASPAAPATPTAPAPTAAPTAPAAPALPPINVPSVAPAQPQPAATPAPAPSAAKAPLSPSTEASFARAKKIGEGSAQLSDTPTLIASLDPRISVRAAIFQRAEVGYIVFDRKLTLTPAALANGMPTAVEIQTLDLPKNSAYRFAVPPNADLTATLDGNVWKIYQARKKTSVAVTTALVAQPDFALGARFLLPLPDAPDPIVFTDPIVGDDLILVPLAQSQAFNVERRTSDLTILPAAQGLVIKPLTDKIVVRPVSDGVEITTEGGLLMSRPNDTGALNQSPAKAKATASGKSVFDFATWSGKPGEAFTKTRQRLQQTIVDVPDAERNRARLELARFYFTHGLGEEAVSLLSYLAKQVPDLRAHNDFLALLGASEVLAYRPDDGLRELSAPGLVDQPEMELWQAVALAQLRDWQHAEEKFAARESVLAGYPEPFFSRFSILAIESAQAIGRDREAADWLEALQKAPHSPNIEPAIAYLRGVVHAKAGRASAAEKAWKEAQASNDRLYKVRAEMALIDLGVSTASLTPAQAADRMEAMRFAWRGDDLEVDILHRLGQFYIQARNIKAGLNVLSQAVTLYPASPLTPTIRTEMAKVFHDVFLGEMGKKLSPLDALTLYQQYRDLMPTGKDGDAVMKDLSERLVAVDLLDQASGILEDLVKSRLQGEEKARAALRLGAIRLLDHKTTEALAALDMVAADIPGVQNEKTLLRARALSEQHRDVEATALLKDNTSQGAKMLRADIAMHAQKWDDAAKALLDLAGPAPAAGEAMDADRSAWLINAATAYALGNDQAGLDRLAIDYGAAMAKSAQNDTFRMLTRPEKTGQLRDLAAAQSQIAQVDMFRGFLNNYRHSVAADAPSASKP